MSEEPSLIDALLELAVYAPVGLAVTLAEELPELIEKGRSRIEPQVGTAQFVGKLVVAEGRRRAFKMAGFGTSAPAGSAAPSAAGEGAPEATAEPDTAEPDTARPEAPEEEAPAKKAAARKRAASSPSSSSRPAKRSPAAASRSGRAVPDVGSLAIPGYDSLSASQVVARLAGLSPRERSAVGRYEAANRGRRTILTRVSQLEGA